MASDKVNLPFKQGSLESIIKYNVIGKTKTLCQEIHISTYKLIDMSTINYIKYKFINLKNNLVKLLLTLTFI